jgi:biotin-(acetyl-CoA carboxylase) ligase
VELTPVSGRIEGVMTGLAADGALIVRRADGSESHVRAGEISLLV